MRSPEEAKEELKNKYNLDIDALNSVVKNYKVSSNNLNIETLNCVLYPEDNSLPNMLFIMHQVALGMDNGIPNVDLKLESYCKMSMLPTALQEEIRKYNNKNLEEND